MAGPRPFVLVLHHHQPVGNFEEVLAAAFSRCYEPVLAHLERFNTVRVGLHYSGPVLEWLVRHQRPFLDRVRALVDAGRAEILGGGFYEPVLSVIPENDALGQVEMMAKTCQRWFGRRPEGLWLAERIWDGDLPRLLAPAGLRYTLVDDHLFAKTGQRARGWLITEKAGQTLGLLPIDRGLRYRIPFSEPAEVVRYLSELEGDEAVTYGDDAEKLGLWPRTHDWVYGAGWLDRFLRALVQAQEERKIATTLPQQLVRSVPPGGRVYLPNGSFEEMMRWALAPAVDRRLDGLFERLGKAGLRGEAEAFVDGSVFGGFFAKYTEANQLHKKMIDLSERLQGAMEDALPEGGASISGELGDRLGTAQRELYRGQCACAYWHGLFGGVYLNHLRHAIHQALLSAEVILDRLQQGPGDWISHEERDLDADGRDEVLIANRHLNLYVRPHLGGAAYQIDAKGPRFCVSDVLTRRPEAYHRPAEDAAVSAALAGTGDYDDVPRACFVDRFFPRDAPLDAVRRAAAHDLGSFSRAELRVARLGVDEGPESSCELALVTEAEVRGPGGPHPVGLEKRYRVGIDAGDVAVRWRLTNRGETTLVGLFATELNLTLLVPQAPDRSLRFAGRDEQLAPGSEGITEAFSEAILIDEYSRLRIEIDAGGSPALFRYPVETSSRSEDGVARLYQGTCFVPAWPVELPPGGEIELRLRLSVQEIGR